jgi:hypothetical protein
MTFINKEKLPTTNFLYSLKHLAIPNKVILTKLEIKDVESLETLIFFNPNYDDLKLTEDLNKKIILFFSYIDEELLPLLGHQNILKIIVFDDLDALFLTKNHIRNFELAFPSIDKIDTTDVYNYFSIFNDIQDVDVRKIIEAKALCNVSYFGYKHINKTLDFNKLKDIMYAGIKIVPFAIFDMHEKIARFQYTIDFSNKHFPIVSFYSALCNKIPIHYGNRYFKWMASETQNPSAETLGKILADENFRKNIIEKQQARMSDVFNNRRKVEEILNEIKPM